MGYQDIGYTAIAALPGDNPLWGGTTTKQTNPNYKDTQEFIQAAPTSMLLSTLRPIFFLPTDASLSPGRLDTCWLYRRSNRWKRSCSPFSHTHLARFNDTHNLYDVLLIQRTFHRRDRMQLTSVSTSRLSFKSLSLS